MPAKRYYSPDSSSDTGNWSVSKEYSEEEILVPFLKATEYERLAQFGTSSIYESLGSHPDNSVKVHAMEWLVKTMILITRNSKFAIVRKDDVTLMDNFKNDLQKIEKILPALYKIKMNHVTKERIITLTPHFEKVLNIVSEIKADIKKPLKRAGLIFRDIEDYDPETIKEEMIKELTERG